ncbi:heterodisulfide reductase-related iron-sulfur binding cluster [Fodinicola feengrottensis]|uniref:Glycolate oxidase iron-sulfur subunit n=2 Tax=Fodinicola feengrottensis TaxID=435914 RepID=A0ABN2J596_9ACTN
MAAFDDHRPPSRELVDDCVHCGFCLPTCPTYVLWGHESDSPRGRIDLINTGLSGGPMTDTMVTHVDRCLGCMACVTACPSGVQYDKIVTNTRAQIERRHQRTGGEKLLRGLIFATFPYPRRLRALRPGLMAYQRTGLRRLAQRTGLLAKLPTGLRAMESIAPPLGRRRGLPSRVPARGQKRAVVAMITGCVQDAFFSEVNRATARILASEGCEVIIPPSQSCCGALSLHNGRESEAARFARRTIDTFSRAGVDTVVINSAGCGSALKEYADVLKDDPAYAQKAVDFAGKVRDLAEFLVELGPVAERHPVRVRAAYHDACHLSHAQGIRQQPRELLRGIPELTLVEPPDAALCCGSAGIYNLLQPEAAGDLGARKADAIAGTGAQLLVTANPGCLMQITAALDRRGTPIPALHTAQILDASLHPTPRM